MMEQTLERYPKSRYFDESRTDLRFKAPGTHRSYRIARLWDLHREICRRVALGEKNKDIAEALGINESVVKYTKRSQVGKDQIGILRGAMDADTIDLGIRIQKLAPLALDFLESVIKGEGDAKDASLSLRAKTAENHMNRAGYSPVKKIASVNGTFTREDIEAIKERSKKSAIEAGVAKEDVIDAEFTETT